jgi:integrase
MLSDVMTVDRAATRIIPRRYKGTRSQRRVEQYAEEAKTRFAHKRLDEITTDDLADLADEWEAKGNKASTINVKLSFYSAMFDEFKRELKNPIDPRLPFTPPEIPWRESKREAKWWLTPELEAKVLKWCTEKGEGMLGDFIAFVTHTGCRVEEALRLQRHHFDLDAGTMTIPGTKTNDAQRTVPMMAEALAVVRHRFRHCGQDTYLFHFSPADPRSLTEEVWVHRNYEVVKKKWRFVRAAFGLMRISTATPKALRRTFARRANDRGMPTEMLRDYMGHSDIATTVEYLRLVGGHNMQAMRSFVA